MYAIIFVRQAVLLGAGSIALFNEEAVAIQIRIYGRWFEQKNAYVQEKDVTAEVRNVEYSILLVMSELSTVRCDRALGLWIAGTRASSVDGELPWRCCGRWTRARTGRQLWRPLLDRGRKRRRKAGFLVCATKPRRRTAVEDAKSWR